MGLSSWLQNFLAGKNAQAQKTRSAREDFVHLFLTRLEDRRVLSADFALVGGDSLMLNNFSQTGEENLTIQDAGAAYQFVLTEGVWNGTDGGGVTGNGLNTLTVDKATINNDIFIQDSANIDVDIMVGPGTVDFSGLSGGLEIDGAGDITQAVGSSFLVSSLDADAASLTLDSAGNDFGSVTLLVTGGATLRDLDDLSLGTISTGDTLQVTTLGVMTLTGNINTDTDGTAGDVLLDGDVELGADITIDTDAATTDGAVTVTGTINDDAAMIQRNFAITSDSGNVALQDDIGNTQALGSVSINAATGSGAITLDDIGTPLAAGITGGTQIGNTATASITLDGTIYNTDGTQQYVAAAGQTLLLNAGSTTTFTTSGDSFAVVDNVTIQLADNSNLAVNTAGGNVTIRGGIRGTSDETVSLNSGAGTIDIGAIGQGDEILSVMATSSATMELRGDIITSSTTAGNFIDLSGFAVRLNTAVTLDTSAGNGTITHTRIASGGLPFDFTVDAGTGLINAGEIGIAGQFPNQVTITGGTVNLNGDIRTTADLAQGGDVTITGTSVVIATNVTIDTTTDNGANTADGLLTVNGPINADGQILTINVGTTDLSLTNAANDFGTLLLTANNATIVDIDGVQLGQSTLGANLNVMAGGAITEAATPGVISTVGNLVLNANGDIGATGTGALDVRVGGTASLTAAGGIFISSDQNLTIGHLETVASQADAVQITTTGTANLTLPVLAADFVGLETDNLDLTTENGLLTIQGNDLTVGTLDLVNSGAVGTMSISSNLITGGLSVNTSSTATITGRIGGTGDLTKLGTGTLILNNTLTGNDYAGNTFINAGTLQLGAGEQITDTSIVMVAAVATLALNDQSETIAQLTGTGNVTFGATPGNVLAVGDANDFTFGGVISGDGNLIKQGSGRMTLDTTSTNTYTGTTTITAGELQVNGEIGNGGPAGTVTVQTGATLSGAGTVNANVLGQAGSFIIATGNGFTLGNAASISGFATAGTLNVGSFSVTLNDMDVALLGATTELNGGTLSAANGLAVGSGDTLQGMGTVLTSAGALTIQSGGTLTPGTGPGMINTNNLVLEAGATYVVELNSPYQTAGTDYDQTNVTGTVTLNGATLQLQGGAIAPAASSTVIIIQNDGTDPILGTGTFNGLAQGSTVTIGSFTGRINYFGGDGNDIVLEVDGAFTFNNTGGGDVTVRENTANGTIEIVKGGVVVATRVSAGVTEIIINGDTVASDTLTVDYTPSFFTQTVTFNGGEDAGMADNDALVVTGGTFGRVEHTFTSTGPGNSGTILYDVDGNTGTTGDQSTVVYNGLEPVDMTGSTITDLVFNLPGTNDQAILEDDGTLGNGISQIRSQNGTFDTTTFANPTGSLTVNLGGDDATFTVDDLPDFTAALSIDGGAGNDTVNFTGQLDLGAGSTGNLVVTAETITFDATTDIDTTLGTVGDVTLSANPTITMADGSLITAGGNVALTTASSGTIQLSRIVAVGNQVTVNSAGNITDANPVSEGAGNENIVANTILLQATTGIGSGTGLLGEGADIDIDGVTLSASNTTSGSIQIFEVNNIALGQVLNTGRTVVIDAGGAITDANTASEGAGNENIIGSNILLQASTGIGSGTGLFGEGQDIDINGVTLSANNTTSGAIQIFEVDDIALDQVSNPAGTVIIDALGRITDSMPGADATVNVTALVAGLRATTGIGDGITGSTADIDTSVGTIVAQTATGDINIDETDALNIGAVGLVSGLSITTGGAGNDITVNSGATLTVSSPVINAGTGDVTLTAENGTNLLINANVTTNAPGNITLSGQNVILNSTGAATPTVEVFGVVPDNIIATTPRNGVVQGLGIITINAPGLTDLNANSTLRTGGGVIQITTDDIDIAATALIDSSQANNGVVIIRNASAGRNIELGGNDANVDLNISDAELDRIRAQSLRIGRLDNVANAGNISITNTFSAALAALPIVQLFAGGSVTQLAGTGFIAGNIGIEVNGSVTLGSALNDAINSLAVLAGGSILFNDANALSVSSIADDVDNELPADGEAGISGVTSQTSFVDLRTVNGDLTILDIPGDPTEVSAAGVNGTNNLAINFLAAGANTFININAGAVVTSLAGAHRYTADNMDIDGTISASPSDFSVSLRNANANVAIDLGAMADGGVNTLELSDSELDNITTNLLAIGRTTGNVSGNITVTNAISPAGTDTLHLITPAMVLDVPGGAILETNLLIEAANGATLDNLASHDVDVLAAIVTNPGANLTFRDLDDITVGTVDRLTVTGANETVGLGIISGITTNGRTLADVGGDVLLTSETGGVIVNQPITTTANSLGRNSGSITINALGTGDIVIDANLVTQGTTIGGNGRGGNILLTTANGNLNIDAGNLLATGGNLLADGGNITLDAGGQNADVILTGNLVTNDIIDGTVRGNIAITADDTVTTIGDISTAGLGTVTITANDSAADGDGNGALTMTTGSSITAEMGSVTLRTVADLVDEATITVEQITTTTGNVLIDANGRNADVVLQDTTINGIATITTVGGEIDVLADDTITFTATAIVLSSGTGNAEIQANQDGLASIDGGVNNADEIFMADGSLVTLNLGTITLRTDGTGGGNITLGRLVTQNGTSAAVSINAEQAVVDGGDLGGADIEAFANANSRINITARTGIGSTANPLDTRGRRFDINNTGSGAVDPAATFEVAIQNVTDPGVNVVIERLAGASLRTVANPGVAGSTVQFQNDGGGAAELQIVMQGVTSGNVANNIEGGLIRLINEGLIRVAAPLNSGVGTGGQLIVNGGASFDAGASVRLGQGNIELNSGPGNGADDILINVTLTIDGGSALFFAPNDIIVNAPLITRVDNGLGTFVDATQLAVTNNTINANITLSADNAQGLNRRDDITSVTSPVLIDDGIGGVLVRSAGEVRASGNLLIEGSDLSATGDALVPIILATGIRNGVHIEADGANQSQILVAGNTLTPGIDSLILQNRPVTITGNAQSDIVIGGTFGTLNATPTATANMNILINANENIHIANNTTIFAPQTLTGSITANVTFGDVVGRDAVIDGVMGSPSNLTINTAGTTTFFGRVGDDAVNSANPNDRIDSLTTNIGGETHIRGGIVTTSGVQTFGDDVLINADSVQNETTFTTTTIGGNVNFLGNVQGLDFGGGGVIEDDLVLNVTGVTTFTGQVGVDPLVDPIDERIGDGTDRAITVNSTGETFFNNRVFTESGILQAEPAGRITFREDVSIDAGNIGSDFLADVTLDSLTIRSNGILTFGTTGAPNADELFILVGSRIDTSVQDRNVIINSRVTDPVENNVTPNEDLFFNLDLADLFLNGSVGNGNVNRFGDFVIETANDFFFSQNDGVQSLFSETLTQLTGINNGTDVADTELRGTINTSLLSGVTLATFNVMYDADIFTNGGFVRTQVESNITHTATSSITTLGGMVVSDASGSIFMEEGTEAATIDTDNGAVGGNVVLEATSDIFISQIRSPNGFVSLTAINGAVMDMGDLDGASDIQTGDLRLVAAVGIGEDGNMFLETQAANLEAQNTGLGRILISNTGDLTIGDVETRVAATVRNNAPTLIQMPSLGGVLSANGDVVLNVSGNFLLLDRQLPADIDVSGGEIVIDATGNIVFESTGVLVQTDTGAIHQPVPMVTNIQTPQVTTEGLTQLTFNVGLPGEQNFTAIVDWGDGTTTVLTGIPGGTQQTISHTFDGNPTPNNPGAPIRVLFAVVTDINIHIMGANVPSLGIPAPPLPNISPAPPAGIVPPSNFPGNLGQFLVNQPGQITVNQLIVGSMDFLGAIGLQDLGFFTEVPVFPVPSTGFGGASIIEPRELPPIFVPGSTANPLPEESEEFDDETEDLESSGSSAEERGEDEVIVRLRVLSPSGQKLFEYEIDPKYLSNPAPLWARLSDGRYQIVIEEPGSSVPIIVRDVELRDHKVIRTFDRTSRESGEGEARRDAVPQDDISQEGAALPLREAFEDVVLPEPGDEAVPVGESGSDTVWENWRPPHVANRLSRELAEPQESTEESPSSASAFVGGLALASLARRSQKDADSEMMGFSKRTLSPAARLRRRLRK